jgi:DNA polymerase III delta subunit
VTIDSTERARGERSAVERGGPEQRPASPLAWFWGEDAFSIRGAVESLAVRLSGPDGEALQVVHVDPAARSIGARPDEAGADGDAGGGDVHARMLDDVAIRIGTAPLFGSGVLIVIREPAPLLRAQENRARLIAFVGGVAPGNGLAFTHLTDSQERETAGSVALRAAVQAAGGLVARFEAPKADRLPGWIEARAAALGIELGPGAARRLAEHLAGRGSEGDIDRRRHTETADAELRKLALYRPGRVIDRDDVAALVPATVPASAWAFLDAVGSRRAGVASAKAEALLASGAALPVLVTQLHRRLRQLVQAGGLREAGAANDDVARELGLVRGGRVDAARYRADVLTRQAAAWRAPELVAALDGLVEVDLASKGMLADGMPGGRPDVRGSLMLQLWIAERVASGR